MILPAETLDTVRACRAALTQAANGEDEGAAAAGLLFGCYPNPIQPLERTNHHRDCT